MSRFRPGRTGTTPIATATTDAPPPQHPVRSVVRIPTVVQFALLALVWGASFLFIKVGLEGLSPGQVVLARLAFATHQVTEE